MNLRQMSGRCPRSSPLTAGIMKDFALMFRGSRSSAVATVEPMAGAETPVLIWDIHPSDWRALDWYEGYPHFYDLKNINIRIGGETRNGLIYIMNDGYEYGTPSDHYLNTIYEGYIDAGIDTELLEQAVERAAELAGLREEPQSLFDFNMLE